MIAVECSNVSLIKVGEQWVDNPYDWSREWWNNKKYISDSGETMRGNFDCSEGTGGPLKFDEHDWIRTNITVYSLCRHTRPFSEWYISSELHGATTFFKYRGSAYSCAGWETDDSDMYWYNSTSQCPMSDKDSIACKSTFCVDWYHNYTYDEFWFGHWPNSNDTSRWAYDLNCSQTMHSFNDLIIESFKFDTNDDRSVVNITQSDIWEDDCLSIKWLGQCNTYHSIEYYQYGDILESLITDDDNDNVCFHGPFGVDSHFHWRRFLIVDNDNNNKHNKLSIYLKIYGFGALYDGNETNNDKNLLIPDFVHINVNGDQILYLEINEMETNSFESVTSYHSYDEYYYLYTFEQTVDHTSDELDLKIWTITNENISTAAWGFAELKLYAWGKLLSYIPCVDFVGCTFFCCSIISLRLYFMFIGLFVC